VRPQYVFRLGETATAWTSRRCIFYPSSFDEAAPGRVDGKDIASGMASLRSRPAAAAPSEASRHLLEFVDTTSNRALFAGVT